MDPALGLVRMVPAFGGLAIFLTAETLGPFRVPVQAKLRHVATNLSIAASNAAVVNLIFGGLLLLWADHAARAGWGLLGMLAPESGGRIAASVVILDAVFYGAHWANHRAPVLWRFHRAHHSDVDLDATTALRFHLGEVLWSTAIKAAGIVLLGISPWDLAAFEALLGVAALWQHSNIRLPDAWDAAFRAVIVTPNVHRIHHSRVPEEHNANFGTIFSWWDRLFNTYRINVDQQRIVIGLADYPTPRDVGFARFWLMPFGRRCTPATR